MGNTPRDRRRPRRVSTTPLYGGGPVGSSALAAQFVTLPAMARISPEEIDRVAALAQLRLPDETRARLGADLAQILEYVDRLQAVPTEGVPLTAHVVEGAGDLRADAPRPSLSVHEALANATDANEKTGLFRVPRVLGA